MEFRDITPERAVFNLEVHDALKSLKAKGLVTESILNGELVYSLTSLGEEARKLETLNENIG